MGVTIIKCVLAFSVTLNVMQARQMIARTTPDERTIVGARVNPLRGFTSDGAPVTVRYEPSDAPTIVYYFSPDCGWCKKNELSVAALRRQTAGRFRFFAVTGAPADRITNSETLNQLSPIWRVDAAQLRSYRFSGTPHTLVVSPNGRVLKAWAGAYRGRVHGQLERYFHIELPIAPGTD